MTSITNHIRMPQISQITAGVQTRCLFLSCAAVRKCGNIHTGCVGLSTTPSCSNLDMLIGVFNLEIGCDKVFVVLAFLAQYAVVIKKMW